MLSSCRERKMERMLRASQFVSVALVVVASTLPLMCLSPGLPMAMDQRECCEKMAGRCDALMTPGSHSCCERPVSDQAATASRIKSDDFGWVVVAQVEAIGPLLRSVPGVGASNFKFPPESPPQVSSVLRI